jgi:outer membrane receptor protein involved in Fe transport
MKTPHRLLLLRLIAVPACAFYLTSPTWAQTAATATTAAQLARYDKNKNGVLDADELAALQADEAKAARAVKTSGTGDQKDEVLELSPFQVTADDEHGYSASNTLAGTRLNSKLEDIAGSISVVTKQQLVDMAALDINDIFLYEVGTEGTGQFTDLTNDNRGEGVWDNVAGNPTGANRIRGLSSANIAVGGFTASDTIPIDTYNIDAVEIARGPNSTLAGLADAGGTVNLITSRANLTRETSRFEGRVDSYGGFRASMDLNRPIIKNKLSVRFSAVYNETGYIRKPSVDRTNRQQYAFTYKPFKTTTISGSFEVFNEWAQRANSLTPRDSIGLWISRGRPTWNPYTRVGTINGVAQPVGTVPTGLSTGFGATRVLEFIDNGAIRLITRGANPANTTLGLTTTQTMASINGELSGGPLYKIAGTNDKAVYDWENVNMAASGYQIQHAKIANVSLDQSLVNTPRNKVDLNVAWRREDQNDYRRQFIGQLDGVGTTLQVDVNETLPDGRPNPYFLRPFIGGVNPQVFRKPVFNDNYRTQLAYQLDMRQEKNILKWLGYHRAIGYGEYRETIQAPSNLRYHDVILNNNFNPTLTATGAQRNLFANNDSLTYPLYYMGGKNARGIEYANEGPVNYNGLFNASYVGATSTAYNTAEPVSIEELYFALGQQKKKIYTLGGSVQSFWLGDRVVTTIGVRKDRVKTRDNLAPVAVNGFLDEANLYNFGGLPRYREGTTKTKGVVVKPFRGFDAIDREANSGSGLGRFFAQLARGASFYYNTSDSFKPADTAYNLYLQELPNPTGESEEFGMGLNMFDNKFSVRLTHFKTVQVHTRSGIGVVATRSLAIDFDNSGQNLSFGLYDLATSWYQQINPALTLAQAQAQAAKLIGVTPEYIASVAGKTISDVNDAESKGWELELQFNPNRYWTLKATGGQQQAIDSNISVFMQQFVDERLPFWTTVRIPTDRLPDGTQLAGAGNLWWTTSTGSNGTPTSYFTTNVATPLGQANANSGKAKPQTREYTLNLITNYRLAGLGSFAESHAWLKSASVGGSYRWASKAAIGYLAAAPDPDGIVRKLDKNKPFFDKPTGSLDLKVSYQHRFWHNKINTTFQLNVRNATESGHLEGVAINPDGKFYSYRIIDPRQFIFTTSFDL